MSIAIETREKLSISNVIESVNIGLSAKDIAEKYKVSVATVRRNISNLKYLKNRQIPITVRLRNQ